MNNLDKLKEDLHQEKSVQEYLRFKKMILNDSMLNQKFMRFNEVKKQMVCAKELGLINCYNDYLKEYNEIKDFFENNVLMNAYFNAKDEVKMLLENIASILEKEINKDIN